ncbi:MAG: hypothetical protein QF918_15280 [Pirellulaceae bacterium]|nr:hypothetical protein [Pirellulaceae bacterium]
MPSQAVDNSASRWMNATSVKVRSVFIFAALPISALVVLQTHLAGAEFKRLPPVRLPQVSGLASGTVIAVLEMDDIVRLAGGAVELRVRQGWWIWEVPMGREVRVALSPTRPASWEELPASGHWICFHLDPANSANPREYLAGRMRERLIEVTGGRFEPLNSIQFQRIGPWDAAELEFSLPSSPEAGTMAIRGSHVLVSTPWGLLEFHTQFPASRYAEQLDETARFLRQVKLTVPTVTEADPTTAHTSAATLIHGSWKAFRSRLRLSSNGRIEIETDRAKIISPPHEELQTVADELLQGEYRADGDLLFVQWRDGSKLNFRWKLNGGDLLLTDHEGQISQLRRIAE